MNKYIVAFATLGLFIGLVAPVAASHIDKYLDVKNEIEDYQDRGACFKADLSFDGKVNYIDLRMINGDPISGEGGFVYYTVPPAPFWYDQDGDNVISIVDLSRVAAQNGRTC